MSLQPMIHDLANLLRLHLPSVSLGIVATVLVLYGDNLNRFFRHLTKRVPFWPRFALFVVLCSAGYGLLSSQLVKHLGRFLRTLSDGLLLGVVTLAFLLLGYLGLAEKV